MNDLKSEVINIGCVAHIMVTRLTSPKDPSKVSPHAGHAHSLLSKFAKRKDLPANAKLIEQAGSFLLQVTSDEAGPRATLTYDIQDVLELRLELFATNNSNPEPNSDKQSLAYMFRMIEGLSLRFDEFSRTAPFLVDCLSFLERVEFDAAIDGLATGKPASAEHQQACRQFINALSPVEQARAKKAAALACKKALAADRRLAILLSMFHLLREDAAHPLSITSVAEFMEEDRKKLYRWAAEGDFDLDDLRNIAEEVHLAAKGVTAAEVEKFAEELGFILPKVSH
jgi:hypothetical protein